VAFELQSNEAGAGLVIRRDVDEPEDEYEREGDYWIAELSCGALRAALRFYDLGIHELGAFFERLATDWRGWSGERSWSSLEGDVQLSATHNGRGTISVIACLRTEAVAYHRWSARAELLLDAGALDRVSRAARLLG
jgi:Family of unknown function (DUF6228)